MGFAVATLRSEGKLSVSLTYQREGAARCSPFQTEFIRCGGELGLLKQVPLMSLKTACLQ